MSARVAPNMDLKKPPRRRQRKKTIGFMSKTTTLHVHHAFFVHFSTASARLQREITKF